MKSLIINQGAKLIKKTGHKFLKDDYAEKVDEATDTAAKIFKKGKTGIVTEIAKKGLELVKHTNKDKTNEQNGEQTNGEE